MSRATLAIERQGQDEGIHLLREKGCSPSSRNGVRGGGEHEFSYVQNRHIFLRLREVFFCCHYLMSSSGASSFQFSFLSISLCSFTKNKVKSDVWGEELPRCTQEELFSF